MPHHTDAFATAIERMTGKSLAELGQADEPESRIITPKEASLVREAAEEQRFQIGYLPRFLVQTTLPHSKPSADNTEHSRTNGDLTVTILAKRSVGLPYGVYPRLVLPWLVTEAVRTKNPVIHLGRSFQEFYLKLGVAKGGKNTAALRLHLHRFLDARIEVKQAFTDPQGCRAILTDKIDPVQRSVVLWDPKHEKQGSLWESYVELSPLFYARATEGPVPIDMITLREFGRARSPMQMDIYAWLTYRIATLKKPTTVPWEYLNAQFGSEYARDRDFRAAFKRHLAAVLKRYPGAELELNAAGLRLKGGRPHIRALPGGKKRLR